MSSITLEKRETILTAAAEAFSKVGFKDTSVEDIARLAAVAKGTVYLVAPSKEELFYQVLYREIRQWQDHSFLCFDDQKPADELLIKLVTEAAQYVLSRPILFDLVCGRLAETMPRWNQQFQDLRVIGRSNLAQIINLGIQQGIYKANLDVEAVAWLLQDFHMATWVASEPRSLDQTYRFGQAAVNLILDGLRTQK